MIEWSWVTRWQPHAGLGAAQTLHFCFYRCLCITEETNETLLHAAAHTHIRTRARTHTPAAICCHKHGHTAQCVVLCSWAVWGQRRSCFTILVLKSCRRRTAASRSYSSPNTLLHLTESILTNHLRYKLAQPGHLKQRNCFTTENTYISKLL